MGRLHNLFKKKNTENLYAPINGKMIEAKEINDFVFSSKMMGETVGFVFDQDGSVYAPCDGVVQIIAPTKHAFWIKSQTEMEVMIHIGLNTVALSGVGFEVYVKEGQKVKRGSLILKVDILKLRELSIDLTSVLAITNSASYELEIQPTQQIQATTTVIMKSEKKKEES